MVRIWKIFVVLSAFFLVSPFSAVGDEFPDFITSNEDYYVTRIGKVPEIDANEYRLEVAGLVKAPRFFTLEELKALDLVELPLTVECIGNSPAALNCPLPSGRGFIFTIFWSHLA
jgi:hypothetical protein